MEIVEERLNEALTTYERTYDGQYTRRSSRRVARKDVFVPIHVYGQLVQHKAGFQLMEKQVTNLALGLIMNGGHQTKVFTWNSFHMKCTFCVDFRNTSGNILSAFVVKRCILMKKFSS